MKNIGKNFIKKINENYIRDKEMYKGVQGFHWDYVNTRKNLFTNSRLNNFLKNDLGYGLSRSNAKIDKKKLLNFILNSKISKNFLKKNLPQKNIGNFKNPLIFNKKYCNNNDLFYIDWFLELQKFIKKKTFKHICEIGGGYGGLARVLLNNFKCKYFLIDLPETNILSAFYLKNFFPKKKFIFSQDLERGITNEIIKKNDIFILTPDKIDILNIKFDFFINARSMMEMKKKDILKYFNFMQRNANSSCLFLNINRYFSYHSGEQNYFYKYPYDKYWKVLKSKQTNFEKHIHLVLSKRTNIKNSSIEKMKSIVMKNKKYNPTTLQKLISIRRNYVNKKFIINFFKERWPRG